MAERRREPTIRRLFEEYFEQDRTPAERAIRAYHAMPPPRNLEEAVTAAQLLGLTKKQIARVRRAYKPPRTARAVDDATIAANARLARIAWDATR